MAAVLFLSSDLMFTSRLASAAKAQSIEIAVVAQQSVLPEKITADCRLAIIDLSLEGLNLPSAVRAIHAGAPAMRIVAYGPHVDEALLTDAKDAGCHEVLTRGQFNKQYAELLTSAARE